MLHGEHLVSDLPVRAEVDVRIFAAGRPDLLQFDLFQSPLSGGSLLGFGGVGGEAGDEFLQLLDLLFFFLVGLLHLPHQQLAGFVPEVVVAGVELNLAVVDVCSVGAYLVQEITVMGYYNDSIFKIDEEVLQPRNGIQIQMVGGLVQQQNIRVAEEGLGQQHFHLDAAVQIPHGGIVKLRFHAQTVQQH